MKIAATLAIALLSVSSLACAANNSGGKGGRDPATAGSLKGNGLNMDGSSDDAKKCRDGTGGAALCQQRGTTMDMQ